MAEASSTTRRIISPGTRPATATTGARTDEQYTSFDQLEHLTVGGKSYDAQYAGTTNADRIRLGDTLFHHGPLGMSAQTTAGADTGFVREPAGTLNSMTVGGKSYYYLTDALGSVVALTDASGNKVNEYSYSPRGVTRNATHEQVPQPYRFAGAYQDPTGLYKMGARYYDTNIGRFTQVDPSGKETNPYLYAAGDYINHTDPNGTFSFADSVAIVAGALTGAAGVAAVASSCALTAGLTCVGAAVVTRALWGAGGGALGATLAGGTPQERRNGALGGMVGGATGGLAAWFFLTS